MKSGRDYPNDLSSPWEVSNFPVYLDLDNYRLILEGEDRKEFFDPIAIKRLGCLFEEEALLYFKSRDEGSKVGRNSRGITSYLFDSLSGFCKTGKVDEFNLQLYLAGKEFQNFEKYPKEKIEELRDFSIELSKSAMYYNSEFNCIRRGLVA